MPPEPFRDPGNHPGWTVLEILGNGLLELLSRLIAALLKTLLEPIQDSGEL